MFLGGISRCSLQVLAPLWRGCGLSGSIGAAAVYLLLASFFISCDDPDPPHTDHISIETGNMVFFLNEGNFRWGNAELGLINLRSGLSDPRFYKTHTGQTLGDVLQSATLWNSAWYLVLNNSGRIQPISTLDLKPQTAITGLTSPRYLCPVSSSVAYVSDLYAGGIWKIRAGASSPEKKIALPGWSEEMVFSQGKLWVLNRKKPWLYGLNPATDTWTDSIALPSNGGALAAGPNGQLWVSTDSTHGKLPALFQLELASQNLRKVWEAPDKLAFPSQMQTSPAGDTVYFLHKGLCRIVSASNEFYRYPLNSGNWYGLGYDASRNQVWLSDAHDYVQNARILQLSTQGTILKEWKGGPITSRFYFW